MNQRQITFSVAFVVFSTFTLGCSDDADPADPSPDSGGSSAGASDAPGGAGGGGDAEALDPQVPPGDAARMAEWLDAFESNGWAKDWVCEAAFTEKKDGAPAIHVHGTKNRVCNNQALAAAVLEGDAELPAGVAALKYVDRGIYVEVKVDSESDGGKGWFWYAPNGEASGRGIAGCTGCHSAAGTDDDHPGLGDYVYFQVK